MKHIILLLIVALFVVPAYAAPTTGAATLVGSNNATVAMTGASTTCWFEWGTISGSLVWDTINQTPSGGACSYRIHGSPLLGSTVFYYRACDVTGCGAEGSFTTAAVTPLPTTTYGATFDNITESGFDVTYIGSSVMAPYLWLVPGFEAFVFGLIFASIYLGIWIRSRDVTIPAIAGILCGGFIFFADRGLMLGIPGEFASIGQGLLYAALAGLALAVIKK